MAHESTHEVSIRAATVVKRFQVGSGPEAAREWKALSQLHQHAPGLAPQPIRACLEVPRPEIVMTRLPGEPLAGPVTSRQLDAIASALDRVHHALPASAVSEFDRIFPPETAPPVLREQAAAYPAEQLDALVRHARDEALSWLDTGDLAPALAGLAECQVFAQGDGNLANFIWDGDQVRVVDFEDCGPRSRAQELADFTEHLTVWAHAGIDAEDFLGRFDLSSAERHQVLTLRRLIAVGWLIMLLPGGPASHRNPAGTLQRAAGRVLGLLG